MGGREAISLADGSRLTLNTNTRARTRITARERRVWLDAGEVLFEVKHDPARPFVVNAGAQQITVMGTRFRVRVEGARTEITVVEGRIALENQRVPSVAQALGAATSGASPTYETVAQLSVNDSAVVQGSSVLLQGKSAQEVASELVWREGLLVFDQRTLAEIAAEFNRYNQTQLLIDPSAAELRLGGSFEARNLASFVRLVQDGFGLKVSKQGQHLRLSR
ncbi:MAG: FecR domain-containing protein [Rhodoferax sp.]|nr:FecR domain-containing protein [Rhodoferax sp.]